jgi:hypothetical protein
MFSFLLVILENGSNGILEEEFLDAEAEDDRVEDVPDQRNSSQLRNVMQLWNN